MPYCYYTCNLVPLDLVVRAGYTPRWLGGFLRDPAAPARRDELSVHPMTCPYVTKLVAAADALLGGAPAGKAPVDGAPGEGSGAQDVLVVPGGCDAARRMGDLLAANYPDRVFVMPMPRSSGPDVVKTLAADLSRLEDWLGAQLPEGAARPAASPAAEPGAPPAVEPGASPAAEPGGSPPVEYPAPPRPGGVFVAAGPLTGDSLLQLIGRLGAHVSGLESCTSPDRWRLLAAEAEPTERTADPAPGGRASAPPADHAAIAAHLLQAGMCPRRSTTERRDYLARRLDLARPSSIIYARQSFCDPGAYDALLVARLAEERGLPYLEIEVDFPFDANGPLHTRVEAFLEAQLLDADLLDDLDDNDLFGGTNAVLFAAPSAGGGECAGEGDCADEGERAGEERAS